MSATLIQPRTPFIGCTLSLQLNGVDLLTLEEGRLIQAVLSFIGQKGNEAKEAYELRQAQPPKLLNEEEIKHVKVVVFDGQGRVLGFKRRNRVVLPGGRVEWDDDDAEAAARREVFERANIALGLVKPVTVIRTKDRKNQSTQTIVFVGRVRGEEQTTNDKYRFMSRETFYELSGSRSNLVRSLVVSAYRTLVTEEIKDEHDEATQYGKEKCNCCALYGGNVV